MYGIGNIELLNSIYTVGIVGSRKCTDYGRKVAYEFAKEMSGKHICIISGMAIGIDTLAHIGAIEKVGKTIAVLGGGFNHIYPKENEWLFHKIIKNGGCVISEYVPDEEFDIKGFPKRNRIISGLSDGILVVEAQYRSGSSITAKYAREQGKKVYVIPSNIYSSSGLGTNIMIQNGCRMVIKPLEIIDDILGYNKQENDKIEKNEEKRRNMRVSQGDDNTANRIKKLDNNESNNKNDLISKILPNKEYIQIYKILSDEPIHINEIAKRLNTSIENIMPIITMMEIEDYVFQPQINYFSRKE